MSKTEHTPSNPAVKTYPCPRCSKPTAWADNPTKPFCSARCKLIDLG
ncbi:DNA gyrase inhibitor YacG, partial [Mycobacterium tuberculosis]|nr:DNA gyrase inhibitor YacG [Mycobacterium tuberculosis]